MEQDRPARPLPAAAGALDFQPHIRCADPGCRSLHPARLAFRNADGRVYCTKACAVAAGLERVKEDEELR